TTTGNPFMSLVLQDKSGDIEAKLWDTKDEHERMYAAETIVRVGGEIHNYRGKNQLRIKSIRPAKPEENLTIAEFLPSAA
ncbi:OB-fold nucleic acid binding domain-containing protein, partial [Streptococcus pneumoniae]|nr:OB-fold nucleic acid binding domain-containing protein [Streptococcus pneumoniae]